MAKNYKRKLKRKSKEAKNTKVAKSTKGFFGKKRVKVGLVILLVLLVILGIYLYNRFKTYDGYKVVDKIETKSGESSKFVPFKGKIVKYSRNGISCLDGETTAWDESYEMKTFLTVRGLKNEIITDVENLEAALNDVPRDELLKTAFYYHDVIISLMDSVRKNTDELELLTDRRLWPMPTYKELLFGVD